MDSNILAAVGDTQRLKGAAARLRSQRGVGERFRAGMKRARKWMPMVREALKAHNVPQELKALPFVESSYNPKARSFAGAAGMWQLMPATAKQLV